MAKDKRYGGKDFVPVSIRLAFEEKAYLQEQAGSQSLSGYIRSQLLRDVKPRKKQRRKRRKPALREKQMTRLYGLMLNSRIAGNLNQIAKKANSGSFNLSDPEEKALLFGTLEAVQGLCSAFHKELGIRFEEDE